jgi:hypothetical protein
MALILSVSYDESLLRTREMLLESEGYNVISALGFDDCKRLVAKNNAEK